MGEATANGPTVADGGVGNPGYCLAEHRCGTCNLHRGLDLRISGERADPQHAVADDDAAQCVLPGDVDQNCGRRQAHVETGEQTLPAGEQTRLVAIAVKQVEDLFNRVRLGIVEWGGLQFAPSVKFIRYP